MGYWKMKAHNKPIHSDRNKRRSFVEPLFSAGYGRHYRTFPREPHPLHTATPPVRQGRRGSRGRLRAACAANHEVPTSSAAHETGAGAGVRSLAVIPDRRTIDRPCSHVRLGPFRPY